MLSQRYTILAAVTMFVTAFAVASARQPLTPATSSAPQARPGGWTIPPDAEQEKNPFAADAGAVAAGKQLYGKNCQRCHGPQGKGDGPDADPDNQEDMDLTLARRAARNPDGVVFYKAWNGRSKPKMPAFKDTLTKDQVWQIVTYVQTLRSKP
jgi:mono/diheme cytochrome c family protein